MFKNRLLKKAFNYWQNKAPVHPLTCGNGCGNLKLSHIGFCGDLNLYCPDCDYRQEYNPQLILSYYKEYLKNRQLIIEPFFRWYDLWIGAFIDTNKGILYIIPIPTLGLKIYWKIKFPLLISLDEDEF